MNVPKTIILESERCRLRFITKSDIPHIFSATRFEGFNDGMLWEPPTKEVELVDAFERNVQAWEQHRAYTFTIELKQTDEFIGRIATRAQSDENVWDIGFWTHPEHQGNGYMTEATRRMSAFCFRNLHASRIVACHALWNKASEAVLKKNGFTFVSHQPQGFLKRGHWVEENVLEMTADRWRQGSDPVR